ncbi:hypothetical protein Tco_0472428 [Tanacetum coccineum]
MGCLVNEHVHIGVRVMADIMETRVPRQEGGNSNVAERKNVKEAFLYSYSEGLHKGFPLCKDSNFESIRDSWGRVFENDVKGSTAIIPLASINVAFVSEEHPAKKWIEMEVAMISMRMKKFYKKTDHFARECRTKGNQDSRRRDAWNSENKDKENVRRSGKQEDSKALVTIDGEGVDWTSHLEEEKINAFDGLQRLRIRHREEQLVLQAIEFKGYTLGLKKVEAQLVVIQKVNFVSTKLELAKFLVNRRAMGTNNVSTARHNFNRQAVPTNAAMKVNTVKTILHTKVNTAEVNALSAVGGKGILLDYPHRTLQNKGIVDSGCSKRT